MRRTVAALLAAAATLTATVTAGPASDAATGPLRYVALGDSFSSGEGAGGYDPATDTATVMT